MIKKPTLDEIIKARKDAGLTQTQAGFLIHKSCRAWQQYEKGDREMDLAYWELFLIKTNTQR
jgi:DNA-binding XRE family transcriptional regulator